MGKQSKWRTLMTDSPNMNHLAHNQNMRRMANCHASDELIIDFSLKKCLDASFVMLIFAYKLCFLSCLGD
ncbi:hypothetical protein ES332_D10G290600v1 [Gossypium tomentosum]|uniref:Uncharacterized protein n=1 Tax=Gossypium tomentosum TaxID=34277 RepID=A0A5D2JB40_GOSTO|nr:hypothetical protein ES332_D10G290600v1 [Gossypium tomentosum]